MFYPVQVKREQGEVSSGDSNWLEMRSLDGMIFFYNLENKSLVWVSVFHFLLFSTGKIILSKIEHSGFKCSRIKLF